jgi:activator of the mannose operon (transcriptional antiterminator)
LKKRQRELLIHMLDNSSFVPVKVYADRFHISEKSIRRDIEELNELLMDYQAEIVKKAGTGIILDIDAENRVKLGVFLDRLSNSDIGREPFAKVVERKQDLLLNVLLRAPELFSIASLSEEYFISKSSIHTDVLSLEEDLRNYQLSMIKNSSGTFVQGNEIQIRRALLNELHAFIRHYGIDEIINGDVIVSEFVQREIEELFKKKYLDVINEILKGIHNDGVIDQKLSLQEQQWLRLGILIQLYRIERFGMINESRNDRVALFAESEVFHKVLGFMKDTLDSALTIEEMSFLNWLLSSVNLNAASNVNLEEVSEKFTDDFIDAFSAITGLSLRSKEAFCLSIRQHIFFMLSRVASNQKFKNPILDKMRTEYRAMEKVCRIICWILCQKHGLALINDDEISYLMVYIQSELIDYESTIETAVLFDEKNSLRNLFKVQLHKRFHNLHITFMDHYSDDVKGRYDLILSTIMTDDMADTCVAIQPILGEHEYDLIDAMITKIISDKKNYYLELVRILNDLHDISVHVEAMDRRGSLSQTDDVMMEIEGGSNIRYEYVFQREAGNSCLILLDEKGAIACIEFLMNNWDYMLFSSKLIYLLENCPSNIITKFEKHVAEEWKQRYE